MKKLVEAQRFKHKFNNFHSFNNSRHVFVSKSSGGNDFKKIGKCIPNTIYKET